MNLSTFEFSFRMSFLFIKAVIAVRQQGSFCKREFPTRAHHTSENVTTRHSCGMVSSLHVIDFPAS
jgi:hypothetical protein